MAIYTLKLATSGTEVNPTTVVAPPVCVTRFVTCTAVAEPSSGSSLVCNKGFILSTAGLESEAATVVNDILDLLNQQPFYPQATPK